jgi:C4-type Zn-finger protein
MKVCPICQQKMDIWTTVHKNLPFVDNRTYPAICFTCYFVPKTVDQKYALDGTVSEEIDLSYSPSNLHTAKELYEAQTAESMKRAKACVEAVQNVCKGVKPLKNPISRPKASWNI